MISGRRLINKGWLEFDIGAGGGPVVGVKGSRNLTNKVFSNGGATLNFRKNGIIPGLVGSKWNFPLYTLYMYIVYDLHKKNEKKRVSNEFHHFAALAVQLDKHTVGYLTYNAGLQSSMSTVLEHNTEKQHFLMTCSIGIPHCFISASYTRKLVEHELKLRLAAK